MKRSNYIVSPAADFFLLGGASLIIMPFLMYAFPLKHGSFMLNYLPHIVGTVILLSYIGNYPHFAYSYQLMYERFGKKITGEIDPSLQYRYIFAGIIVPAAMIAFFIYCLAQNSARLLSYSVNFMFLTAGWHYAKQGFGVLIVSSVYQRKFYSPLERKLLLLTSHMMWIYAWVMFNTGSLEKHYIGITFHTLGFPVIIERAFFWLVTGLTVATAFTLFGKYRREKVLPPFTGITAYIATAYLWIILRFGHGFDSPLHPVVLLIPFMHSMQYITIVLKMKHNQTNKEALSKKGFWIFTLLGLLIGLAQAAMLSALG